MAIAGKSGLGDMLLVGAAMGIVGAAALRKATPREPDSGPDALVPEVVAQWVALTAGPRLDSGPNGGRVAMVIFSDYQCPFCASADLALDSLMRVEPGVGVVYRHFPISRLHPWAYLGAVAAVCADEQGGFQEMHRALFAAQARGGVEDWDALAHQIGLSDIPAFHECWLSDQASDRVDEDLAQATRLGIHATPTFLFEDGHTHAGALSLDDLRTHLGAARSKHR